MDRKFSFTVLILVVLGVTACNDSVPNYPIGDGGWIVSLEIGNIPNPGVELPVFIDVNAQVINLTDGSRPTDGSVLRFRSTGGSFENGEPHIDIAMRDGAGGTVLQIDQAGRYEVSAEYVEESCISSTTIDVGF